MKPFIQIIPTTGTQVAEQIAAILTIAAFEKRPEYILQIETRVHILERYLYLYNDLMGATFSFLRDPIDNSLCLTCK